MTDIDELTIAKVETYLTNLTGFAEVETEFGPTLPMLVNQVRAMARALLASQKALRRAEWVVHSNEQGWWQQCPSCDAQKKCGHDVGCELAAALLDKGETDEMRRQGLQ